MFGTINFDEVCEMDIETEKTVAKAAKDVTTVMREASLVLRSFREMSQALENKSHSQSKEVESILQITNDLAIVLNQKLNETISLRSEIKKSIDSIQRCFLKVTQMEGFNPSSNIKEEIEDAVENANKIENLLKDLESLSSRRSAEVENDGSDVKFSNLNKKILNLNKVSENLETYSEDINGMSKTLQDYFENTNQYISNLLNAVFKVTIEEMNVNDAFEKIDDFIILDVRRRDEFDGDLGHIAKAKLLTVDENFDDKINILDKSRKYLMVCRSGGRSARASTFMKINGFSDVTNMTGGMLAWNDVGLPIIKKE